MWFKKKAYISGYKNNTAVDGTDWRTTGNIQHWLVSQTLPSAADAGKYFYLPALGYYIYGRLDRVGDYGAYWSSSAYPWSSFAAYGLYFDNGHVYVNEFSFYRNCGFRVGGFK